MLDELEKRSLLIVPVTPGMMHDVPEHGQPDVVWMYSVRRVLAQPGQTLKGLNKHTS